LTEFICPLFTVLRVTLPALGALCLATHDYFSRNSGRAGPRFFASQRKGPPDLVAEAKQRELDPELVYGDKMESLSEEVMVQPPRRSL
jgi:hypothetical protein